jgi:ribosome biogenesis protein UTP30
MMGNGPVYTVKIGRMSMPSSELVKNIIRAVYRMIPHIVGSEVPLTKIRQICIKGYNTPSLPIYNYLNEEEVKIMSNSNKSIKTPK